MAERHPGIAGRKFLFFLFTISSIVFLLSWFFVLRSTHTTRFIDYSLLPKLKSLAVVDNSNSESESRSHVVPSLGNQAILKNNVQEQEELPQMKDGVKCHTNKEVMLKIYMYDLPPEFHFALLGWKAQGSRSVWPDIRTEIPPYPGGLNLQHSIEYWLTLDLLRNSDKPDACSSVIRVRKSSEADLIFVPFFSSLSYNKFSKKNPHETKSKNRVLEEKLVEYVTQQEEWKRSGGKDHIVVAHHPNSLSHARMQLWPAMLILSDFGRYPPTVANVDKDVIAPYKHVIGSYADDTSDFDSRSTLLYFQGAIYRKDGGIARQELFYLLKDEKDVHFSFGSVQKGGIKNATRGMHSSKFCLNIAGDTPSSNRLFDAIASHCVPVIISDEIELPFEDILDYSKFCIFFRTSDAVKPNFLINKIRSIKKEEWTRMRDRLKEVEKFFEFQYPSKEGDAIQMIWQAVARKLPAIRLKLHRSMRYSRTVTGKEKGLTSFPVPVPEARHFLVKR